MRKRLFGAAVVLMLSACASTQVKSTWKSPGLSANAAPKKLLVVAMIPEQNIRAQVEQKATSKLNEDGMQAVPVSQFVDPNTPVTKEKVAQLVQENGFEGVLVSRVKGTDEATPTGAGTVGYGPYFDMYGPAAYHTVEDLGGGYGNAGPSHQMETSLFDAKGDGKLIWTASSNTFASSSENRDVTQYVSVLLDKLDKDIGG